MSLFDRLIRMLPLWAKRLLKAAAGPVDRLWIAITRRHHPASPTIPGLRLRSRVGAGFRPSEYLGGGCQIARDLEPLLSVLEPGARVLDFGCGCGRVMVHVLHDRPDLDFTGCDVDPEAIAWASRNIRSSRFFVNRSSPPLGVPNGAFDFVYSISILTHLDRAAQLEWIEELRRVTSEDGRVLVTTCGRQLIDQARSGRVASNSADFTRRLRELPDLDDVGEFCFVPYVRTRANDRDFSGVQGEYGLTFQTPAYSERAWKPWFDVVSVSEGGINHSQDALLMKPTPPQ